MHNYTSAQWTRRETHFILIMQLQLGRPLDPADHVILQLLLGAPREVR
ncbi:hypothetical protein [Rhodoligotrophos defluvii]|nr:hypothetical protein [Rhodoligotrophos defluvii]